MQALTFSEFKTQAKIGQRVAVFAEMATGTLSPVEIYEALNKHYENVALLEDLNTQTSERYSFFCAEPLASLKINHDSQADPIGALRALQSQFKFVVSKEVSHLITNSIGYFAYEAVRFFEDIPDRLTAEPSIPLIYFNFYALNVTFNHAKQTILISYVIEVGKDHESDFKIAKNKIQSVIELFNNAPNAIDCDLNAIKNSHPPTSVEVDISDTDFMQKINRAKQYVIAGDAFQIVLSRTFKRRYSVSDFNIYQTLRKVSPSPFMFYFPTQDGIFLGASPERMIRVQNKKITVNPIAGTRKRSQQTVDAEIETDLLSDKKEMAEHMMLVDLARNDVGKFSQAGTVQVKNLAQVKHYSHVSHITSVVEGKLDEQYDALDAFKAAFPAGTLSGAPKIRAMEIINELETSPRGLYAGAICRFDALNNLESCIAIRMAVLQNGQASVRTGCGIVYDSNPHAEILETKQKAAAMLTAIAKAHGEENVINY